jgi:hypothetical protein
MSKSLPWLRLHTEIIHDPKLSAFTDAEKWLWICLLCLAGESDVRGEIHMSVDDIVWTLRCDRATLSSTISKCEERDMLSRHEDGTLVITHFLERQYDNPSDHPEAVKERVARHRENKRNDPVTTSNDPVTSGNAIEERRGEETIGETELAASSSIEQKSREGATISEIVTDAMWEWAHSNRPDMSQDDVQEETDKLFERWRNEGKGPPTRKAWEGWILAFRPGVGNGSFTASRSTSRAQTNPAHHQVLDMDKYTKPGGKYYNLFHPNKGGE